MSKSVLVIETPENCYDCPIGQDCSNILEASGTMSRFSTS